MMVPVDEARDHDVIRGPEDVVGAVPCEQVSIRSNLDDRAVALEDGAVGNHVRLGAARDLRDHVLALDERRCHALPLGCHLMRVSSISTSSCSSKARAPCVADGQRLRSQITPSARQRARSSCVWPSIPTKTSSLCSPGTR